MIFPGMAETRILAALSLVVALSGCNITGDCGDTVFEKTVDPESGMIAWGYVRNCGATTGFATHVAVGKPNSQLADATTVLIIDSDHGKATMGNPLNAVWIGIGWSGRRNLSVTYASKARVFEKKSSAAGATMTFQASEPYREPSVVVY